MSDDFLKTQTGSVKETKEVYNKKTEDEKYVLRIDIIHPFKPFALLASNKFSG